MPPKPKLKTIEFFLDNGSTEALVAFKFTFSITGSYTTWEVWCNGKERSDHKPSGSFSGTISEGATLKVEFKIWNGSYNITYECKTGTVKKEDPAKPSPITGQAMGSAAKVEEINIQF